jgi:K+-sensing histidine kinase KdpD
MSKRQASILACVTNQQSSGRIIERAAKAAAASGAKLQILSIQSLPLGFIKGKDFETLEYLYGISKQFNAEMTVICSKNPALTAIEYIKRKHITNIITGKPTSNERGFVSVIAAVLPKVKISSLTPDGTLYDLVCINKDWESAVLSGMVLA